MQNFRNLHVWQKAHQLALKTYEVPAYLLKPEAWPLRDQVLRAAISIPSNIAGAPDAALMPISAGSSGTPWVRAMSSIRSFFSATICGSSQVQSIPGSGTIFPKCGRC